jgi:hypothetical protein
MRRNEDESSAAFAARVQLLIAEKTDSRVISYDGGIFYKPREREKFKATIQKLLASEFLHTATTTPVLSTSDVGV